MKVSALAAFVVSAAVVLSLSATGQQPDQKGGGKGGRGGFGGPGMRPQPGQIMAPFLQDRLKLSDDQRKQLADLQKEVDGRLDKLLTDDQKAELKKLREQGPGGPGGFPGGGRGKGGFPGGGGKGGFPGGKDRGPPPQE
jgi:hypothetical protein